MKIAFLSYSLLASVVLSTLSACVVVSGPGDKPDSVPPRLVKVKEGVLGWDRPQAFGPVPAALKAAGDSVCKGIGSDQATGYHPKAQDLNGKTMEAGGYYCVGKKS